MNNESVEIITAELDGIGPYGEAIGQYQGKQVSVFGAIPGEKVTARIIRRNNDEIIEAVVEDVITPSPYRRSAACPFFGQCSGCQWQHITYQHQLEQKLSVVRHYLEAADIDTAALRPVEASPMEYGYRNHARFTVRRRLNQFGFINRVTRRFVPVDHCMLMSEGINSLISALRGRCTETTQFSIRYGINTDEYLIQPRLKNPDITVITGQQHYHEILKGRRFRVSSPAFFQVNTAQAEKLADIIRHRLNLTGMETVIDAYAGVGTFAVLLAPYVKKAIAIEESKAAIKDARVNIRGIGNIELLEARTESVLPHLGTLADAVIIDPARNGCHPSALRTLNFYPPGRLVYVSCNPEALARDLTTLIHGPYDIEDITPVDLFPQTHHIETVVALKRNPAKQSVFAARQNLILASASPRRAEILTAMGLTFNTVPSSVSEAPTAGLSPKEQAISHAGSKSAAIAAITENGTVIAADTIVVLEDEILGKPNSQEQAVEMLKRLRGKKHLVITAMAATDAASGETQVGTRNSRVTMRHYTDNEIDTYVNSGSPMDKAGAYGIQDKDFNPVAVVKGCYLNVVGLPVCLMMELLLKLGVHPAVSPHWHPSGNCPECRKWETV